MILGDFTVVGLSETSITLQQVPTEQPIDALVTPFRAGGFQQTLPATLEQTKALFISQVVQLVLNTK